MLDGGTLATDGFAKRLCKPCLMVQLDEGGLAAHEQQVRQWLQMHPIQILNVAGPRKSKRPGVYPLTKALLTPVIKGSADTGSKIL